MSDAIPPLEQNVRSISPTADPLQWNLNKALLEIAREQMAIRREVQQLHSDIRQLLQQLGKP